MNRPSSHLDATFIASQRRRLEAARGNISSAVRRGADEDLTIETNARSRASESEDQAQDSQISDDNHVLIEVLSNHRDSLDRALAKMDEGTYGFSDESGLPIPLARLEAYPEAIRTASEEDRHVSLARGHGT